MEMMQVVKLCDSNYCRLCAEENQNGTDLFSQRENCENLSDLVNRYLPIKVENNGKLPSNICPGCLIQLEATKSFMDLIIEGQARLRDLYSKQQNDEKQRQKFQEILQKVNPKSTVKTYNINTDESGVSFIQIYSDGPLFPINHELSLKVEGLEKPKRKRGRPPKPPPDPNKDLETREDEVKDVNVTQEVEEEEVDADGRRRRKIRRPLKYEGVIQGEELEKVFQQEGILNEHPATDKSKSFDNERLIGKVRSKDGEDLDEPVYCRIKPSKEKKIIYQCRHCKKQFSYCANYKAHLKLHKTVYLCSKDECKFKSEYEENSDKHKEETGHTVFSVVENFTLNNDEEKWQNDSTIKTEKNEDDHSAVQILNNKIVVNKKKPTKIYCCNFCSKVFSNPSSLMYHRENEHNEKCYACLKCNKTFKLRQQLLRHQTAHSQLRPYPCSKCSASFKTRANLSNHQLVHTREKRFACSLCNQRFTHKASLTLHRRWHNGEKPFKCEYCEKRFTQKGNLIEHERVHTGEKPYCCDQCGNSFKTSSQFHLHVKRHTGEKRFVCQICSKAFLHQDTYKVHIRRHLNDRPFKCKLCLRSFPEAWALKRHQRIHTKEKPFECEVCGKTFGDRSNKNKHMKIHSGSDKNAFGQSNLKKTSTENAGLMGTWNTFFDNKRTKKFNQNLQLTQLIDPQGNPITITTADGQSVAILTDQEQNEFKGLMPDGTVVPFDLNKDIIESEDVEDRKDSGILSLEGDNADKMDEMIEIKNETLKTNMQLITTEDGQEMCLITYEAPITNDGNVINQHIDSTLFLTST